MIAARLSLGSLVTTFWAFPMMYSSSLYALDLIEVRHTLWIMFPVDIMYSSMSSLSRNTCSGSS